MRPAHSTLRYLIDTETNRFYIQARVLKTRKCPDMKLRTAIVLGVVALVW
jgi:hypothetical protein